MKKNISILGSTGSIGLSSLQIIKKKKEFFNIILLSANKNYKLICSQIEKYKPRIFVISDRKIFMKVKLKYKNKKIKIYNRFNFLEKNKIKNDITIAAIPGMAGLEPTINLIKKSKKILLANKESIIAGWSILKKTSKNYKTKIVPIDSEHFSIENLIRSHNLQEISKIYITASGGPFLNYKVNKLKHVTVKDALKHPKWKMGKKITIDSATMMNKFLELIEANKLFNIPLEKLEIVVHPESLVHAIIKFKNGLTKFIYHETSMLIPLANAIFDNSLDIKDFIKINNFKKKPFHNLTFHKIDSKKFPINILLKSVKNYPAASIIINASNEILVNSFLAKKLPFLGIFKLIKTVLKDKNYSKYAIQNPKNLKQIYNIDLWARKLTEQKIKLNYA